LTHSPPPAPGTAFRIGGGPQHEIRDFDACTDTLLLLVLLLPRGALMRPGGRQNATKICGWNQNLPRCAFSVLSLPRSMQRERCSCTVTLLCYRCEWRARSKCRT
jgi:hypothetical protein